MSKRFITAAAVAVPLALILSACAGGEDATGGDAGEVVRIGTVGAGDPY